MVLLLSCGRRSELATIAAVAARLVRTPAAGKPKLPDQRKDFAPDANNGTVTAPPLSQATASQGGATTPADAERGARTRRAGNVAPGTEPVRKTILAAR